MRPLLRSQSPGSRAGFIENFGTSLPFVVIDGAGNNGFDNFFEKRQARFDRNRGIFVSTKTRALITRAERPELYNIRDAVEARKVIYASHYFIEGGKPLVHEDGCIGVEESCVYVSGWGGTSFASASLGSAMASLLAVFPGYDVFDLSALVSSCAKSYPSLPGGGIVDVPCMIETICAETGSRSSACSVEQHNVAPVLHRQNIGTLENPRPNPDLFYTNVSGISAISGWVCDADEVVVEINGEKFRTGYRTTRGDTRKTCGDDDNGFSFLFNWNLLGDGVHTVKAYADGKHFATARVKVTTLGKEFVRNIPRSDEYGSFLTIGSDVFYADWEESLQNFVISDGRRLEAEGHQSVSGLKATLENPSLGSLQSGISAISGWVCDAEEVVVEINGAKFRTGYRTTRGDTRKTCGDDDNGFSFLFNWNLLGDGVHTVKAYADGVLFASTKAKVTTPGTEFLRGHQAKVDLFLPWSFGRHDLMLEWWEPQQNLVISRYLDY